MERQRQVHTLSPFVPANADTLILGSFPSVRSRETGFYYGHRQNRFWRVLAKIYGAPCPTDVGEKKALLAQNKIALWDVAAACEIIGSSDASIQNVLPNDIAGLVEKTKIDRIFLNGKTAENLYRRYIASGVDLPAYVLPSTSPANAAFDLARLSDAWAALKE